MARRKQREAPRVIETRDAQADEVPTKARQLAALAVLKGWGVRTTFARAVERVDGVDETVDSIGVRMRSPVGVLVGIWINGRFASGMGQGSADGAMPTTHNLTELTKTIEVTRW